MEGEFVPLKNMKICGIRARVSFTSALGRAEWSCSSPDHLSLRGREDSILPIEKEAE